MLPQNYLGFDTWLHFYFAKDYCLVETGIMQVYMLKQVLSHYRSGYCHKQISYAENACV
jgi:hypothetical protein